MADSQKSPRNCQSCTRKDSAENEMVQCGSCKLWEHFSCAGVNEEVRQPDVPYTCKQCEKPETSNRGRLGVPTAEDRPSKGAKGGSKASSKAASRKTKKTLDPTGSVTSSVRAAMLAEQLKLLEEERVLAERELLEQEEIKKRQMEEQERRLEEKRKLAEEANLLRDRKMNEEMELKRKQQQVRRESFEKRQEIIRQLAETSSRSSSVVSSKQKVKDWLNGHDTGRSDGDIAGQVNTLNQIPEDPVNIPSAPFPSEPYNPVNPQPVGQVIASSMNQFSMHPVDPSFLAPASVPLDPEHPRPLRHGYQQHSIVPLTPAVAYSLSQAQIAARQVLGKDLPAFNGNPEDWPIFISNFEQSSATCGYSDAENLVRLQRSLKGHALESVKSRLLLPASVPHVIQTLRTLYGRPELIIRSLMSKIQHVAAPRHDRLETLIQFGLSVQNFVDHLKAANHQNHLSNPVLMQQLVEKLPGSMKLDWAVFKNKNQPANLETFGDFMSGLVTAASEVSFDLPGLSNNISKNDRHKPRDFGAVYSHSGERAPFTSTDGAPNNTKASKPCAACGRAGHRVSDCHQFQNASVDERWELVQQKGLCRTCLNSHGKWSCRSWNSCGIEGCRQKHHTLLHTDSPRLENLGISASHVSSEEFKWPLFRIVPVTLFNNDNSQTIFAFIDEGSSYTLLEESVATQLETSGQIEPLTLQWTGNVKRVEPKSQRVQIETANRSGQFETVCAAEVARRKTLRSYWCEMPAGLEHLWVHSWAVVKNGSC